MTKNQTINLSNNKLKIVLKVKNMNWILIMIGK